MFFSTMPLVRDSIGILSKSNATVATKQLKLFRMLNNPETLNIFTDASLKGSPTDNVVCSGAIAVTSYSEVIDSEYLLLTNVSNNFGELSAIKLAVNVAYRHQEYSTINIISDSLISVKGLVDWIKIWIVNRKGEVLYSASHKPVINQDIYLQIINSLIDLPINEINICHTLGHMRACNLEDQGRIIDTFKKFNNKVIGREEAAYLATYNNLVDKETRVKLVDLDVIPTPKLNKGLIPVLPTLEEFGIYSAKINV